MKDHQESWLEYRPHRPRLPSWSRNTCKPPHSYAVDKRAVKMRTVDTLPSAVDNSWQYRPQESLQTGALMRVRAMRSVFATLTEKLLIPIVTCLPTEVPSMPP